jgi:hypothetical protein
MDPNTTKTAKIVGRTIKVASTMLMYKEQSTHRNKLAQVQQTWSFVISKKQCVIPGY